MRPSDPWEAFRDDPESPAVSGVQGVGVLVAAPIETYLESARVMAGEKQSRLTFLHFELEGC